MNPNDYNNGQQSVTGVNSAPQQAANGQYEVLPTPSITGHPTGHNPYEFIVNPNTVKRSGPKLFGGNSFVARIVILVGGAILLMIVATIALSVLLPSKTSTADMTTIAQQQQEIVRIATVITTQATDQDTRNFAVTVQYSVGTSQTQVLDYLTTVGVKLKTKQLAQLRNTQTDTLFTNATATSTFDSVSKQTLTELLNDYESSLKSAYSTAKSTKAKLILQNNYAVVTKLLQAAQQA